MNKYGLDPLHYYTAPGFSWDALFKYTEHIQELMTDFDMYMLCEQGIQGGISMICNRYSRANNQYMKDYDAKKPSKLLLCGMQITCKARQCLKNYQQEIING
jgi:hypothetical protein